MVVLLLLMFSGTASSRAGVVYSARTSCRDIALTYDTEFGPRTQALADLLDELNVRSTWFFLGTGLERHESLVRQVAARHQIGNHSHTHPIMPRLTSERMRAELRSAQHVISTVAGIDPRPLFRPPYGEWNSTLLDVAGEEGYSLLFLWSIDTRDWAGHSAETIRQHITRHAVPGAIVLMHGRPPNTVEATRLAVDDLRSRGFQFVTLTELMGIDRHRRDFGGDPYIVQPEDTWEQVGICHNVTGSRLKAYNDDSPLVAGQQLAIPHIDEMILRLDEERLPQLIYPRLDKHGWAIAHVRFAEQLGAAVDWDGFQVHIRTADKHIVLFPGDRRALVNDVPVEMETTAVLVDGRVLAPVEFLARQLGAGVRWEDETWTFYITSPPAPAEPSAG